MPTVIGFLKTNSGVDPKKGVETSLYFFGMGLQRVRRCCCKTSCREKHPCLAVPSVWLTPPSFLFGVGVDLGWNQGAAYKILTEIR